MGSLVRGAGVSGSGGDALVSENDLVTQVTTHTNTQKPVHDCAVQHYTPTRHLCSQLLKLRAQLTSADKPLASSLRQCVLCTTSARSVTDCTRCGLVLCYQHRVETAYNSGMNGCLSCHKDSKKCSNVLRKAIERASKAVLKMPTPDVVLHSTR